MPDSLVTQVDTGPHTVSCQVVVPADTSAIFDLVADPHRHPELDGSGTVRDRDVKGPDRLSVGAKFGVGMKQYGVPYAITSTCTAIEENELVEWQHPLGHRWRWKLEQLAPGSTRVTETFDYSTAKAPKALEIFGMPAKNKAGITSTLEALVRRFS